MPEWLAKGSGGIGGKWLGGARELPFLFSRWSRILRMTGSVTGAMTRSVPPKCGAPHFGGNLRVIGFTSKDTFGSLQARLANILSTTTQGFTTLGGPSDTGQYGFRRTRALSSPGISLARRPRKPKSSGSKCCQRRIFSLWCVIEPSGHRLRTPRCMTKFLLWLLLFILCWPLALFALVLYPFVWLLSLPFRLVGIAVTGVFDLLRAILLLPARLLRGPKAVRAS